MRLALSGPVKTPVRLASAAAAMLAIAVAPPAIAKDKPTGEERLEKLLEGRVAGEPLECITSFKSDRLRVFEGAAYVYGRGNTIYVQRTKDPESIDDDDILIRRSTIGNRLCRVENLTTVERYSGIFTGPVFFEKFVPYTRVEKDTEDS